jgi:hypothetical protein
MRTAAVGNANLRLARGAATSLLLTAACASSVTPARAPTTTPKNADTDRAHTIAFADVEEDAIGWLAAADPRLASRAEATAPDTVLKRIGT